MKGLRWVIVLAALALVAAACGDDGGSGVKAACDGTIDSDTLTVWVHEGSEADAYVALVDDFNANEGAELGLTIELTQIPEAGYTDAVNAAAAADDLPDVIDFDGPVLANFAWGGNIVALDDCISDDWKDNLLPSIVEAGTYEGNL